MARKPRSLFSPNVDTNSHETTRPGAGETGEDFNDKPFAPRHHAAQRRNKRDHAGDEGRWQLDRQYDEPITRNVQHVAQPARKLTAEHSIRRNCDGPAAAAGRNRRQLVAHERRDQADDQQSRDRKSADKAQPPLPVYLAEQDRSGNQAGDGKRDAAHKR